MGSWTPPPWVIGLGATIVTALGLLLILRLVFGVPGFIADPASALIAALVGFKVHDHFLKH